MTTHDRDKPDDTAQIVKFVAVKAAIFILLPAVIAAATVYLML